MLPRNLATLLRRIIRTQSAKLDCTDFRILSCLGREHLLGEATRVGILSWMDTKHLLKQSHSEFRCVSMRNICSSEVTRKFIVPKHRISAAQVKSLGIFHRAQTRNIYSSEVTRNFIVPEHGISARVKSLGISSCLDTKYLLEPSRSKFYHAKTRNICSSEVTWNSIVTEHGTSPRMKYKI